MYKNMKNSICGKRGFSKNIAFCWKIKYLWSTKLGVTFLLLYGDVYKRQTVPIASGSRTQRPQTYCQPGNG